MGLAQILEGGRGREDEVKDREQTGFYHFLRGGDDFRVFVYGGAEFLLDIADEDGRVS